ncbi:MAG TPA: hypothetical protein VL325_06135 [Pyrinomonadaceae bacterium]|jgi:hypothetical protein|nr:hypothetical protein [Pyrinomonadaceae bacterium]
MKKIESFAPPKTAEELKQEAEIAEENRIRDVADRKRWSERDQNQDRKNLANRATEKRLNAEQASVREREQHLIDARDAGRERNRMEAQPHIDNLEGGK